MHTKRILLVGASPDKCNRNSAMRNYVAEGIIAVLGRDSLLQSSLEQAPMLIELAKPQMVLVFGSCMPADTDYLQLYWASKKCESCLAFWLHDDPYEFDYRYKIMAYADYIFTNDRWSCLHYEHERTYHLPMAASPTAHLRPWVEPKTTDLFFCGVAFPNRVKLIRDIQQLLSQYSVDIIGAEWPTELTYCINRRIDNVELSNRYAQSLLTLNLGRTFNYANEQYCLSASTPGPRTFEAAMAGACQLFFVDGLEIVDYFVPNQEILLFDSVSELSAAMKRLKAEPDIAKNIGQAAQARCLSDHTYEARIRQLLQLVDWVE